VRSCLSERKCARQRAEQFHGFVAGGTERRRQRCGRGQGRRRPIQQREDALPVGFAGGAQPAKGAHALEAPGQDVLEKAMEESLRREPHRSSLAAAAVAVTESDEAAVVVEDALGNEGGAIQVSGEVLEDEQRDILRAGSRSSVSPRLLLWSSFSLAVLFWFDHMVGWRFSAGASRSLRYSCPVHHDTSHHCSNRRASSTLRSAATEDGRPPSCH